MKPGTAAIIAMFDADQRLAVEQALPGSPAKSVVQTDKKGSAALKGSLAEAMGKFEPGPQRPADPRSHLRWRGGPDAQGLRRRLADDPGAKAPDDAPNVLLVIIDDAGYGAPGYLRRPGQHAHLLARPADGPDLQPLPRHGGLLADACRAAYRPQPAPGRLRLRSPSTRVRSPATPRNKPKSCTALPRILKENGYVTGGFGKWHLTPNNVQGAAGPFDHWPKSWGFDHWWGFLSGAAGQYDPIITQDDWVTRHPGGHGRQAVLLPRRHHRQVDRVAPPGPGAGRRPSRGSCSTRPAARMPRTTSRRSGPTSTRACSMTAGTSCASGPSSARSSSASSRRTPS